MSPFKDREKWSEYVEWAMIAVVFILTGIALSLIRAREVPQP